jgi:hypothetical protein
MTQENKSEAGAERTDRIKDAPNEETNKSLYSIRLLTASEDQNRSDATEINP